VTDSTLAFLRELERADGAAAAELEELDVLSRETEAVRARAAELIAFRERLPAERESRARVLAEAERALADAESAAARAAAELEEVERSGDADRATAARRFEVRARDERSVAERRAREARERVEQLAAEAEAAERETAELEQRAGELARALGGRPRLGRDAAIPPEPGLAGVVDWGIRARAALLVARSQLTAEREAISRQANELASVLLGESQTAAPPSIVARRVERALGQS
jgi:chromosome segregation protein